MRVLNIARRWVDHVRNAHPDHHAIARAMIWVALFVFISRLAGAAKEVVIAWRYGTNAEIDAYIFLFNLVSWPVSVWFSVLMVVLVPMTSRMRQELPTVPVQFRAELLGFSIILGVVLALLAWYGLPFLLRSRWTGLPSATVDVALTMVPLLVLLLPIGVVASLFSAWMLARGWHANTLLEGVPALVLFVVLIGFPGGGVQPLLWGTVAGFVVHLASLIVPWAIRDGIEKPRFTFHSPQWHAFWNGFGLMLIGQVLMSFIGIIDQFFVAPLGTGAIASLGYANRILALILGLGAMAVGRATLPVFSQALAQGSKQVGRIANRWARLLFILGVATMVVGWVGAPYVVKLLFQRGAFTNEDTTVVTEVLRYALMQLPFYFSALVLVSYVSSQGRYGLLLWSGIIGLLVKSGVNVALIPMFGIKGVAAGWAPVYAINALFFWLMLRRTTR